MFENKSVKDLISLVKKGDITIRELNEYYIQKIKKINPKLNAIVSIKNENQILDEAVKKDKQKNKSSLLFGLPIAIKDLSDVAGIPTTYGYEGSKNNLPKKNSLFVDRLIKNGAIIIGKTNTAELGVGGHTTNRLFGPTSNVYDLSKSAAGSSGGASSAVASGILPFADGTDQMGSCRGPAAYANIYGFRPTPGLIPSDRSNHNKKLPVLTTPGCFARTPEDMAFFLDATKGQSSLDPYSFELKKNFINSEFTDEEFSNLKICWLSDMEKKYELESEILELCNKQLISLEKNKIEIDLPKININVDDLWESWTCLRSKSIYEDTIAMNIKNISEMTYQAIWEFKNGLKVKDDNINFAMKKRNNCFYEVEKLFEKYDFLALPSAQVFPFDKNIQYPTEINSKKIETYHKWLEIFIMSSLLDLPTITVPVGFNKNGYPMGLQIIGKKGSDLNVYNFAKKYENIFNFSNIKPKISSN
tara:strand:+ start:49 stop:1470 length:1422 start_codon:yes stop_codon:yes gene_type:complete